MDKGPLCPAAVLTTVSQALSQRLQGSKTDPASVSQQDHSLFTALTCSVAIVPQLEFSFPMVQCRRSRQPWKPTPRSSNACRDPSSYRGSSFPTQPTNIRRIGRTGLTRWRAVSLLDPRVRSGTPLRLRRPATMRGSAKPKRFIQSCNGAI